MGIANIHRNFDWEMILYWTIVGCRHGSLAVVYLHVKRDAKENERRTLLPQLETRLVEARTCTRCSADAAKRDIPVFQTISSQSPSQS
jgi:hypothetical protein